MSPVTRESPGCPGAMAGSQAGRNKGLPAETSLLSCRIPPNLRSSIYCSIVATGGEKAWDFIWERFKEAVVVSEADKLRTALSCSPYPWILNRWVRGPGRVPLLCPRQLLTQRHSPPRYLQYTLDPNKIRKQDATATINSIASNVVGQPLAWDFIRSNWRMLFSQ